MKKAKYTIVSDGVTYEKGGVYSDEEVKHLDPTDFEDTEETATVVADQKIEEVKDLDTEEKEEVKEEEIVDDNKGDETKTEVLE